MKNARFLLFLGILIPCCAFGAAGSDFQNAAQLLAAARRGDTRTIQFLVNSGADINYVDSTGLSLVCTAVMNNDKRAIQILQMYGADASNCDRQIKNYKRKTKVAASGEEYGFFSGLSSSHIVALSAVGVAAVIGGVALLTNVFDSENNNTTSSGGTRPGGDGGGGNANAGTALFSQNLPYGPACSGTTCPTDFTDWGAESSIPLRQRDFAFMSDQNNGFNYLMASYAYSPFIRGYLGMNTIRISSDKSPFNLKSLPYIDGVPVGGGKPVNVAMITSNGINTTGSAVDGIITWIDPNKVNSVLSICDANGDNSTLCQTAFAAALNEETHKYYNYSGPNVGKNETTTFDLSGAGTVFGLASDSDTKLAKIIAGWEYGGRADGDYYGFIPNGQLTVYKTGAGQYWGTPGSGMPATGSYNISDDGLDEGDTFTIDGTTLVVTSVETDSAGGWIFTAEDQTDSTKIYQGYIVNNNLYISSTANGDIDAMYAIGAEHALTLSKTLQSADYKTYSAISKAISAQDSAVVVNLALPASSIGLDYVDVLGAKALYDFAGSSSSIFVSDTGLINQYYNTYAGDDNDTSVKLPGVDANNAFTNLGIYKTQIWVNPAGWNRYGTGSGESMTPQYATFENFMPVVYSTTMQNRFMTVVALKPGSDTGTNGQTISDYSPANVGKLELSTWHDTDGNHYQSRICGLTGTGNGGALNPWCFAAPGETNLDATAAMAGGVALVRSAFDYMSPDQVFLLLALTADGPYLGKNPETDKVWASNTELIEYLDKLYTLPLGMNTNTDVYLDNFKQAFGYGMINLARATKPNTNVYFFDGTSIVSSSTNKPYWGTALSTNSSRASSVLSLAGRQSITTSFYDVLESSDGSILLPRVWKNTIALDDNNKHGLYMGDVLGDFNVGATNKRSNKIGDLTIDMAVSQRAYNDNLSGLDNMRISWTNDNFDLATEYQHYLTDGESRFSGRANGVLGLMSNTMSANTMYKRGRFAFGGRAFVGAITDENLLDKDPVISSQFEPGRLGLANGGSFDTRYIDDKFGLNVSFGMMQENNTVLGMVSDGLFAMNNANTKYVDTVATYKPFDDVKLSLHGTFATTHANNQSDFIASLSDIKSNAFAFGADVGGFSFTVAMPLAVTSGRMGYGYADFEVVENNGKYEIAVNNAHMEYIDLSAQKRELRFSAAYKSALGEFTDAGVGLIYRLNPNNTDMFGNESILMFKLHHRLGI